MKSTSSSRKLSGFTLALAAAFAMSSCGGSSNSSNTTPPPAVSVSLNQSSVNLAVSATTQFKATVLNSTNTTVTWSVDSVANGNSKVGTISSSGLYTAPAAPGSHTVTATSAANTAATATAKVAVGSLTVTPATVNLAPGATEQFNVSVEGFSNTTVTWYVDKIAGGNSTVGTISSTGLYTAPATLGSHTITAASAADTSDVASATINIGTISLTPAAALLAPAQTQQFSAAIAGVSNATFTWSVDQIPGGNTIVGTISSSGLYTAPATAGAHTVTAASTTAPSDLASSNINVATIALSPATATIVGTQTQQFTANVQGTTQAVTWYVDNLAGGNSTTGTISSSGLYTAPSAVGPHTVSAQIAADPSIAASSAVTVFTFSVSPNPSTINPSATEQFTATLQGISNSAVTWSVDGVAGGNATTGTISPAGLYTAPYAVGRHTISATSAADSSATVNASITVINFAPGAVLTFHNDDARDGAYTQEVQLTPRNVNSNQFGKLLSYPVDAGILGQPLYVPQLSIGGGTYDVVFVTTQNNSVYAFNDATSSGTAQTFWQVNLNVNGLKQGLGIGSTPVIDITTNTMYVLAETTQEGSPATPFHLHALNLTTGADLPGSPVLVTGTVPGTGLDSSGTTITLETSCTDRMGLALDPVSNSIYIGFGDCNHGWLLAYDKTSLTQTAIFNDTPDGGGGGLWSSGGSPAIDDTTGDLYLLTGVDKLDWTDNLLNSGYNDSFLRLSAGDLSVLDFFTPDNYVDLGENDADLGSGGNIIVPGSSTFPNLTIGGGKDGNLYVVNRSNMGRMNSNSNNVLETVLTGDDPLYDNIFDTPVYWNGSLYFHCNNDVIRAFNWNPDSTASPYQPLSPSPTSVGTAVFQTHGATPSLSANGTTNGIVWDIDNTASGTGPAVLHAYDATNVAIELYNSSQAANGRDTAGTALKFNTPTIANGKVFVPTATELDVYGLLP